MREAGLDFRAGESLVLAHGRGGGAASGQGGAPPAPPNVGAPNLGDA